MAKDLLFEIGAEEIPAGFMPNILGQLKTLAETKLNDAHLPFESIATYGTPRRLALIVKPSPDNIQELYLQSLATLGIHAEDHDIRFVEDNWESPTLGAWGLGWEVWLDGMEVTQFTYFQQVGSIDCKPVSVEITYGLERLAMYIQGVENVYDLKWNEHVTYGDVWHANEVEQSVYNFELADTDMLFKLFDMYEAEAKRVCEAGYVLPAYDYVLKCSHTFNLLDSRGAISISERTAFIGRVRALARICAQQYLAKREELGFPLLKGDK